MLELDTTSDRPEIKTDCLKNSMDIKRMVNETPPPVEWIIKDLLPCDIVGIMNGRGGSGKSFAVLDLAVSVATGSNFLHDPDFKTGVPSKVLAVFGEETEETVHRRLNKVCRFKELSTEQKHLIDGNLSVYSAHGHNPGFFNAGLSESEFYTDLLNLIEYEKPSLVILDPLSRFYKQDENNNTEATRFIEQLEKLKTHKPFNETRKTSVVSVHHSNKPGKNEQGSSRGASAFIDGARWQCVLNRDTDQPEYINMTFPKSNYTEYGSNDRLLKVMDGDLGGVLGSCHDGVKAKFEQEQSRIKQKKVRDMAEKKTKSITKTSIS
jgi:RecA-family ATPase